MKLYFTLFFLFPCIVFSQISGKVLDINSKKPISDIRCISSANETVFSDSVGFFHFSSSAFPQTLYFYGYNFILDSISITKPTNDLIVLLNVKSSELTEVVVSAGRRKQRLEDIPISLEVLKPYIIDNKGSTSLEDVLDQSPGVYAMDGQVSIRGGSGFSYGAGSRVLVLWNGIPLLSGDAGDAKWNAIPLENTSRVEILKGASSVLYGAGALNGIISLIEKEPTEKLELKAKALYGFYDNPQRESLKWWKKAPSFYQADIYIGKMYKKMGYTFSASGFQTQGYRDGETENRIRVSGTIFFKPSLIKNLKTGIGYNLQQQHAGSFIIWQSDSLAYTPSGGSDTSNAASTLNYNDGIRLSIDPYITYTDKWNFKHQLKTRYYQVSNLFPSKPDQNAISAIYYLDYQMQRSFLSLGAVFTAGFTGIKSVVDAELYGDHRSSNKAFYFQYEQRFKKKITLTIGMRGEYFEQDGIPGDSDYYYGKDSSYSPVYPIFRSALHYAVTKTTHLRFSYGQGIRYPSVAERYTKTSVGNLLVFPNPTLKPETGTATEIGIKQVLKIGNWKALIDVAGFVNQYDNMMEFTFGNFKPDSIPFSFNPNDPGYPLKWIGFQAQNTEKAHISGMEFSFNSEGKIGNVEILSLMGYTYMNPISLNTDSLYQSTFSDSLHVASYFGPASLLKYRFKHLAKADLQITWKEYSIGISARYNSYMRNIDAIFEDGIFGQEILPGLKKYRQNHAVGSLVFDLRLGYTFAKHYCVGFMINNLLNAEYMTRPGDIQAPRSYLFQVQYKL